MAATWESIPDLRSRSSSLRIASSLLFLSNELSVFPTAAELLWLFAPHQGWARQVFYYHELCLRGRGDLASCTSRGRITRNSVRQSLDPATEPDFYKYPSSMGLKNVPRVSVTALVQRHREKQEQRLIQKCHTHSDGNVGSKLLPEMSTPSAVLHQRATSDVQAEVCVSSNSNSVQSTAFSSETESAFYIKERMPLSQAADTMETQKLMDTLSRAEFQDFTGSKMQAFESISVSKDSYPCSQRSVTGQLQHAKRIDAQRLASCPENTLSGGNLDLLITPCTLSSQSNGSLQRMNDILNRGLSNISHATNPPSSSAKADKRLLDKYSTIVSGSSDSGSQSKHMLNHITYLENWDSSKRSKTEGSKYSNFSSTPITNDSSGDDSLVDDIFMDLFADDYCSTEMNSDEESACDDRKDTIKNTGDFDSTRLFEATEGQKRAFADFKLEENQDEEDDASSMESIEDCTLIDGYLKDDDMMC